MSGSLGWHGRARAALIAAASAAAVVALLHPAGAGASSSCPENGSLFWGDSTQGYNSTGTEQDLLVRQHTHVASGCATNGIVAGGTSHESPQNGNGALFEVGWRDKTDGNGNHYYRLFVEACSAGTSCYVQEFSSACAAAGTWVTMEVRDSNPGSSELWTGYYACNGGGFSSLGTFNMPFYYANDRVETFRYGGSGFNEFILDYHDSLKHWDKVGTYHANMGHLVCDLGMSATFGSPNANPATDYQTKTSGTTC